jgi:hypothetical protein
MGLTQLSPESVLTKIPTSEATAASFEPSQFEATEIHALFSAPLSTQLFPESTDVHKLPSFGPSSVPATSLVPSSEEAIHLHPLFKVPDVVVCGNQFEPESWLVQIPPPKTTAARYLLSPEEVTADQENGPVLVGVKVKDEVEETARVMREEMKQQPSTSRRDGSLESMERRRRGELEVRRMGKRG